MFLLPVTAVFAGFLTYLLFGEAASPLTERLDDVLESDPFSAFGLGCILLFAALVASSLFIVTPVFTAAVDFIFACFITSSWSCILAELNGDISFLHIICVLVVTFAIVTFFIVFSEIELVFYSSVSAALHRDSNLRSELIRLLSAAIAMLLIIVVIFKLMCFLVPT